MIPNSQVANFSDQDDYYFMSNLGPKYTGLPFIVWISTKGYARHDIRVKVALAPRAEPDELISVAIRPTVRVIGENNLSASQLELLTKWIQLNFDLLVAYWNGDIDTGDLISELRKLTD